MSPALSVMARAPARFHQLHSESTGAIKRELLDGLCAQSPYIDPKFFYDSLGSTLFNAITLTPEYYPTRAEAEIFSQHIEAIAAHVGSVGSMIDLGAADCRKAESLFSVLRPSQYVPVDISIDYLRAAVSRIEAGFPDLDIVALGMDFSDRLVLPAEVGDVERLFFYPGSSIGNLSPETALPLLSSLREACGDDGGLLIGIDRVKDPAILTRAYDDALGVTSAFNLNVLRHINAMIGSNFDISQWRHVALFDEAKSRVEMHLEARCDIEVELPAGVRQFDAGERIHTECSYKYTPEAFTDLLRNAGFSHVEHWTDSRAWFSVFSARP